MESQQNMYLSERNNLFLTLIKNVSLLNFRHFQIRKDPPFCDLSYPAIL